MEVKLLLSEEEKLYYSRQIVLPNIGITGQVKIKQAKVLVVGIGGLGTFSTLLLAEMGVGYLRIVDRDIIEKTNLHRTPLYSEEDLDHAKVEIAAKHLKKLNPSMEIDTHACHINNSNISDLLEGIDLVIDGLDNFDTRRIVSRECVKRGVPFIFCGVSGRIGNVAIFNSSKDAPCLACLYHEVNDDDLESCDVTGIHPALLAIITGLQVHEAINFLLHRHTTLNNSLLFVDLQNISFNRIPIQKSSNCKVCSTSEDLLVEEPKTGYSSLALCGPDSFMVVPEHKQAIALQHAINRLEKDFDIIKQGELAFSFKFDKDIVVTIFRGGNALIRGTKTKDKALKIWEKLKDDYI